MSTVIYKRIKTDNISLRKERNPLSKESSYILSKIDTMVKSKTQNGVTPEPEDAIVIQELRSYIKQMNQILEVGDKLTEDQINDTKSNINFATQYLPEDISEDQINSDIDQILSTLDDKSMKSMGKIIKTLKDKYGTTFNGSIVTPLVKNKLA